MFKLLFKTILSVFVVVSVLFPVKTIAQGSGHVDTPYETAYKNYLSTYDIYQASHQDYVLKRSAYLSFKSLKSQDEVQAATVKMLQYRDDVLMTYLTALRERVNENAGLSDTVKTSLITRIELNISWFKDHKDKIPTAGSLKDLVDDSKKSSVQFSLTSLLSYETLSELAEGKVIDMDNRLNNSFDQLKSRLVEIKSDQRDGYFISNEKSQRLDDWVYQADNSIARYERKRLDGDATIALAFSKVKNTKTMLSSYESIITYFSDSQRYLREAGGYMQEIIQNIKIAEN
jgi:hypothetical protein